ncbi:MAG TPA: hypothetical protein VF646_12015 [Cytophagales bacterium]
MPVKANDGTVSFVVTVPVGDAGELKRFAESRKYRVETVPLPKQPVKQAPAPETPDPEGLVRGVRKPTDQPGDANGIWANPSVNRTPEERSEIAQQKAARVRREAWQRPR